MHRSQGKNETNQPWVNEIREKRHATAIPEAAVATTTI